MVFFNIILDLILNTSQFQLFFSVILDLIISNCDIKNGFFLNEWFNFFTKNNNNLLFFSHHPELFLIFYSQEINLNITKDYINIIDFVGVESWLSPSLKFLDLIFLITLFSIFLIIYFSYYNSFFKENTTISSDYLNASTLVESEKEISSLDDIILSIIIIFYIFGWFFYIHAFTLLGQYPELMLVFYLIPFLVFLIMGVPSFLLIDFGIYFLVFLRGCGSYTSIFAELMYDYINIGSFYVRLCVQWVRLLLMYLTFIVMHDTIVFCHFNENFFIFFSEFIWDEVSNIYVTFNSVFYLLFDFVYSVIFRLLFELVHTLFVCTAQLIAFFAIVFWFFFFLYTFFVSIKFENYFSKKRFSKNKNLI